MLWDCRLYACEPKQSKESKFILIALPAQACRSGTLIFTAGENANKSLSQLDLPLAPCYNAVGVILICTILIYGIYLSCQDNYKDFGGTITDIRTDSGYTVITFEDAFNNSYTVIADSKTKVQNYHKEDGDIALLQLVIGNKIQGDYKRLSSKENYAKLIEVL